MSEEKNAILASLQSVSEELKSIGKDQQGHGYKFRGIDDVLNALNPLFKKYKILTARRDVNCKRTLRKVTKEYKGNKTEKEYVEVFMNAKYVFKSLIDGSEFITEGFGEGQDSSGGDKASSMATSNSYKYVIFEMFNVATEEQKDSDQVTAIVGKKEKSTKPVSDSSSEGEVKKPTGARKFRRNTKAS